MEHSGIHYCNCVRLLSSFYADCCLGCALSTLNRSSVISYVIHQLSFSSSYSAVCASPVSLSEVHALRNDVSIVLLNSHTSVPSTADLTTACTWSSTLCCYFRRSRALITLACLRSSFDTSVQARSHSAVIIKRMASLLSTSVSHLCQNVLSFLDVFMSQRSFPAKRVVFSSRLSTHAIFFDNKDYNIINIYY